jgi:hypothetical protein
MPWGQFGADGESDHGFVPISLNLPRQSLIKNEGQSLDYELPV